MNARYILVSVFCLVNVAQAETGVWIATGQASADATVAANWQGGYVPTNAGDSVSFPSSPGAYNGEGAVVTWPKKALTFDVAEGLSRYRLSFSRDLTVGDGSGFAGVWCMTGIGSVLTLGASGEGCTLQRVDSPYLNTYTVPEGARSQVGLMIGASAFRKSGAGTLVLDETPNRLNAAIVSAGTLGFAARSTAVSECGVAPNAYLHFDASAADSVVTSGGSVTQWTDVRDIGLASTVRKAVQSGSRGLPRVVTHSLNGLDTITFGATDDATAEELTREGANATLEFPQSQSLCECFVVCKDNVSGRSLFPLGDSGAYHFHRGSSDSANLGDFINTTHASVHVRSGDHRIDGLSAACTDEPKFTEWKLYSYALKDGAATARYFARDRSIAGRFGGVSLAEVVLYTNRLTVAERQMTIEHLMAKWLPTRRRNTDGLSSVWMKTADVTLEAGAGRTATVSELQLSRNTLTKTGAGTLAVVGVTPSALSSVRLQSGALRLGAPAPAAAVADGAVLHLDADDDARMTKTVDELSGKTYVSEWPDTRTDVAKSAVRRKTTDAMPFLVSDAWNGHNYLDFGPFVAASGGSSLSDDQLSANACLEIPAVNVCEGYLVLRDISNGEDPFFIGHTADYSLHRKAGGMLDGSNASTGARSGVWSVDLTQVEADKSSGFPTDRHVIVGFRLPSSVPVRFLARDRACRQGGLQYGEVLLYDRVLTETERRATRQYLMQKWHGEDDPVAVTPVVTCLTAADGTSFDTPAGVTNVVHILESGGAFGKTGAGRLEVGNLQTCSALTASGGTLAVGSATPDLSDAYLHLDATEAATMTGFVTNDTVQCVTRWEDARRNGQAATAGTNTPWKPTLRTMTVNGVEKPVIHFGDFKGNNTLPTGDETGSWMQLPRTAQVKEVFLAFADVNRSGSDCQFLLTDTKGTEWVTYDYHRGVSNGSIFSNDSKSFLRNSSKTGITVDGTAVSHTYVLSSELHVISVSITNGTDVATVGSLCCDRNHCRWGGAQYGEVLIFTNVLTTARRAEIVAWMNRKWLGTGRPYAPSVTSVSAGGTVAFGAGVETLAEGTVLTFTPQADGSFGEVAFDSPFVLPTALTIRVDGTGRTLPCGDYPLVTAPSFGGDDLSGWTLDLVGSRRLGRLVLRDNAILLRVSVRGSCIIVR